jgi:hypothetical protein
MVLVCHKGKKRLGPGDVLSKEDLMGEDWEEGNGMAQREPYM